MRLIFGGGGVLQLWHRFGLQVGRQSVRFWPFDHNRRPIDCPEIAEVEVEESEVTEPLELSCTDWAEG